ncbi:hypothetical protein [Nonomuraea dietziae]|uniref:hypothetical protein n=1 Tax=Nonomuraea dietziae TaxID=65515 RepID=UPI0031D6A499
MRFCPDSRSLPSRRSFTTPITVPSASVASTTHQPVIARCNTRRRRDSSPYFAVILTRSPPSASLTSKERMDSCGVRLCTLKTSAPAS